MNSSQKKSKAAVAVMVETDDGSERRVVNCTVSYPTDEGFPYDVFIEAYIDKIWHTGVHFVAVLNIMYNVCCIRNVDIELTLEDISDFIERQLTVTW